MPFAYTCTDHPEWCDDVAEGAIAHLKADHPDCTLNYGPIETVFTSMAVAQGNPQRRLYRCRRCATSMEATVNPGDPEPPIYCEECT